MVLNYRQKIITLWTVFLLGTLFHTQLGLMPLFHGLSIVESHAHNISEISWIMWLMLGFFVIPMIAIIATAFTNSKRFTVIHFGITVLYSILNLLHVIADLLVQPILWYQIALMVILFVIGLLINIVAYQWMQNHSNGNKRGEQLISSAT